MNAKPEKFDMVTLVKEVEEKYGLTPDEELEISSNTFKNSEEYEWQVCNDILSVLNKKPDLLSGSFSLWCLPEWPSEKQSEAILEIKELFIKSLYDRGLIKQYCIYTQSDVNNNDVVYSKIDFYTPHIVLKKYLEKTKKNCDENKKVLYRLNFTKDGRILLNGRLISKPDFNSENYNFFEYIFNNPNEKISRKVLENKNKLNLKKTFHQIANDLGFEGELCRLFFNKSKSVCVLRNPITENILNDINPNMRELEAQIAEREELMSKK